MLMVQKQWSVFTKTKKCPKNFKNFGQNTFNGTDFDF